MNDKNNKNEKVRSIQERLDKIIEKKAEQTSALKKLLEKLENEKGSDSDKQNEE
jgi:hypothetical protein